MSYVERVEHNLSGLRAVSTGACGGCDQCREAGGSYTPSDDCEREVETWGFKARPDAEYPSEEACEAAARVAFEEDCRAGKVLDITEFSWGECGICGSRLGGSREVWHAIDAQGRLQHFDDACTDCVLFLANGDVPEEGGAR